MSSRVVVGLVAATLVAAVFLVTSMFVGGDRRVLLVGETTNAHHQIEMSCETCHGTASFADAEASADALNKACRNCHEDELDDADDSHPRTKFRNPRMAAYWDKLDARLCTTCHLEHRPEITSEGAVTVAMDFCVACHAEGDQDVRADRPSHANATYDTWHPPAATISTTTARCTRTSWSSTPTSPGSGPRRYTHCLRRGCPESAHRSNARTGRRRGARRCPRRYHRA